MNLPKGASVIWLYGRPVQLSYHQRLLSNIMTMRRSITIYWYDEFQEDEVTVHLLALMSLHIPVPVLLVAPVSCTLVNYNT